MRYIIAVCATLGVVILVNMFMVWLAVTGADPVVPSYLEESR